MAEAALINDPELRAQKELLIQEQYGELINGLVEQNQEIRNNLQESAFLSLSNLYEEDLMRFADMTMSERELLLSEVGGGFDLLLQIYGVNTEEFRNMTEDQQNAIMENIGGSIKALSGYYNEDILAFRRMGEAEQSIIVNAIVPQWNSGVQAMAEVFYGENGFEANTIDAWNNIKEAENEYANDLNELELIANETFSAIADGEDVSIEKAQGLIDINQELIDKYGEELKAVQDVYAEVSRLADEYHRAYEEATKAAEAAYKYRQQEREAEAAAAQQATQEAINNSTPSVDIGGNGSGTGGSGGSSEGAANTNSGSSISHDQMVELVYQMGRGTYGSGATRKSRVESAYPGMFSIAQAILNEAINSDYYNYSHNGTT